SSFCSGDVVPIPTLSVVLVIVIIGLVERTPSPISNLFQIPSYLIPIPCVPALSSEKDKTTSPPSKGLLDAIIKFVKSWFGLIICNGAEGLGMPIPTKSVIELGCKTDPLFVHGDGGIVTVPPPFERVKLGAV